MFLFIEKKSLVAISQRRYNLRQTVFKKLRFFSRVEGQEQNENVLPVTFLFFLLCLLACLACAGRVTRNTTSSSGEWMDYRSPACVQRKSDEPCCALVSIKHHLITGCVFIIIIFIIIIIISLLPSLKSETMGSP